MAAPLWEPSAQRIADANMTKFRIWVENRWSVTLPDYDALYRWSVEEIEAFWVSIWEFGGVVAETRGARVLANGDKMPGAQFFPDAKLNFAANLLRRRDDARAILFWSEDKIKREMSYRELYDLVSRLAAAMKAAGVGPGDRVAGWLPNMPETVACMLATGSLGAVWSSSSPDFGVKGVLDRFGQIDPKLMFCADGYHYNGKTHDCLSRAKEIIADLPTVRHLVVVPHAAKGADLSGIERTLGLEDFIADHPAGEIDFAQMPFNHPLYIMFSSGTTGAPKCIVHGAGGTLLQHLKEHQLHTDVKKDDQIFYFTTCGWMMWNWLVSALASRAALVLYDGSPFHPTGEILFDLADASGMTVFGTSAKYIDAVNKAGLAPKTTHKLDTVRAMTSTGSPLVPESFDFVYEKIKSDLCLSSITGGTDIVSCFILGNPVGAVWRGELQTRGLGMAVVVYDDNGKPVRGEKGELVCVKPFPCMPISFWNDPDGVRYRQAYFETYENIWRHGDFIELTEHDGAIVYGRSDAVLNPGGVRIGTAEIYRQVEQLDEVEESIVIGQSWEGDVRVVLFVKLRPNLSLNAALTKKIKTRIRRNTTPRHVPAKVVQVPDIPRTKSGKIVELAVRSVVEGDPVKNREALANPEALDHYKDIPALRDA